MSDSYVTSKATIKCSCGDKCAKLTVYPDRTVFLTEKPMANISDHVSMYNIAPFGKCHTVAYPPTGSATAANHGHITAMPCVPGTVSEWINGKSDYIVKGKPALLKSSYCRCQWGGVITITDDGQVDTGNPDLEKLQIETEEEWKEKEQEELLKDKDALLDGIQTALDLAGFAPGVGAIPDLLNAAIYAVRGDKLNAGLSLLAAVPGIGDAAAATKIVGKGVKVAKATKAIENSTAAATKTAKQQYKLGELTQQGRTLSGTNKTSPSPKFGDITMKGHQTAATPKPSPSTTPKPSDSSTTPKPKSMQKEPKSPSSKQDVSGSTKCNNGILKDVFKYKGSKPNPKESADKMDLSS